MSAQKRPALRRLAVFIGAVIAFVLIWIGLTSLIAALGIRHFWGKISVGQMLLNLVSVQTDGGGGSLVWMGIFGIGVLPIVVTLVIAIVWFVRHRKRRRADDPRPRRKRIVMRTLSTVLVALVFFGGTTAFATTVGMGEYLRAVNSNYDIGSKYKQPTVTSDAKKRNMVVIYLESGEATLSDTNLFEKDAFEPLKNVTKPEDGWQSIDNYQQYEGGGWTMAGISSTQCGVPLKSSGSAAGSHAFNKLGGDVDSYLGGLTCMGDVLADHGYKNVFMGGANPAFSGKNVFLQDHGYSEDLGLPDWRAAGDPENEFRPDWGLGDGGLMKHARTKIDQLHADAERTGQPFNLSMLTVDTHEPVHIFDYCNVDTKSDVTSVYSCSMAQVAGFVDYMKQKGYLDDTSVVIMGDHLKHMSAGDAFHEELDNNPNRSIFNRVWVPGENKNRPMRAGADQLNMYPTTLEAAGLELKDHEAGLGVSAFTQDIPSDSAQAMKPEDYSDLLDSQSSGFYKKAWAGEKGAQ